MRHLVIAMLAAAVAAGASCADPPADPAQAQVDDFLSKSAKNAVVPSGAAAPATPSTTYEAVFGELGKGSLSDAEATAKAFVKSYGKILNFPDGDPLGGNVQKFREWSGDDGKFIAYAPTDKGDFYLPGMVVFVFKTDGSLVAAIGRFKPIGKARAEGLSADDAMKKALEDISKKYPEAQGHISSGSTVAEYLTDSWLDPGQIDKVYWCELSVGQPPLPKRALVIASLGTVTQVEDGSLKHNSAHVFDLDPIPVYEAPTHDLDDLIDPGFWHDWTINGTHFKVDPRLDPGVERADDWIGWFNDKPLSPSPNPKFCEEMVYYHLTQARTKAAGWGAAKDLDRHDPMFFNHWQIPHCSGFTDPKEKKECEDSQTNQAWFNPADLQLNFASKNPLFGDKHPAYDASVICHEYGHFVHKMLNEHFQLGAPTLDEFVESIAVAEAFGDLFSGSVLDHNKIAYWLAHSISQPYGLDLDKSRNLETMKTAKQVKGQDPHDMACAYAGCVWKLRTDGTVGTGEMMKLMIASLRLCKLPCSFRNAALAYLAADQQLAGGAHMAKIASVFNAQGMMPPLKTGGSK